MARATISSPFLLPTSSCLQTCAFYPVPRSLDRMIGISRYLFYDDMTLSRGNLSIVCTSHWLSRSTQSTESARVSSYISLFIYLFYFSFFFKRMEILLHNKFFKLYRKDEWLYEGLRNKRDLFRIISIIYFHVNEWNKICDEKIDDEIWSKAKDNISSRLSNCTREMTKNWSR